jgi:hypothetical protein
MSKNSAIDKIKQPSDWESFLKEAKTQLKEAQARVAQLTTTVQFFEQKIRSGEPVPEVLAPKRDIGEGKASSQKAD